MNTKRYWAVFFTAFIFLALTFTLCAQTSPEAPVVVAPDGPPEVENVVDYWNGILMILITVVSPLLVRTGKFFLPQIPNWFLPILGPILASLANMISGMAGGPTLHPMLAAALGAAGTGVREIKDQVQKKIAAGTALIFLCVCSIGLMGCQSTQTDPVTGAPVKVYDPVKTQQVKDAVMPLTSGAVRRVLENNPERKVEIAKYLRAVAAPFCSIAKTGEVDLSVLGLLLDQATADHQDRIDPIAIDVKNSVLALFKIYYADRFKAELPEEAWTRHVADVICLSINQGLKDAGQPGVL